jgi:LacI family transcriptional regulator
MGVGQSRRELEASLIESMISYHMDGLILVAPQLLGVQLARYAKTLPIVVIGHHEPTASAFDTVNSDDQQGAAVAVKAFLDVGIKDISMLSMKVDDPDAANVVTQREIGFIKALQKVGLGRKNSIIRLPWEVRRRPDAINTMLQSRNCPRALFCWSDLDAVHVLDCAKRLGMRVPEDLAVIGYDNSSVAALSPINLTSIDQSGNRLGELAAEALISRISGRKIASHVLVEPTLVVRATS